MKRPALAHLRLVTSAPLVDTNTLTSEFPTIKVERAHAASVDEAIIDAEEWRAATTFEAFDEAVARSRGDAIMVRGERDVEIVACEALTRYQRLLHRRNGSSRTPTFGAVLRVHQALDDETRPRYRASIEHALDTWQWMLRLEPSATLTAQLAALFHDVEPTGSTTGVLVADAPTPDASASDPAPGGDWALEVLRAAGAPEAIATRVREIVTLRERRGKDTEMDLLNDADALSFLSLDSASYLDRFGPDQTREKLAQTLERLGRRARTKLALVRLRPDVHRLLEQAA